MQGVVQSGAIRFQWPRGQILRNLFAKHLLHHIDMAMKKLFVIVSCLVGLVSLDMALARTADREVRKNNAGLDERLANADLAPEGARKQACEIHAVYRVYVYQTCFVRGDGFFQFVYHKPKPLVLGYGRSEKSYYFQETVLGESLATIRNGVVVERRLTALGN